MKQNTILFLKAAAFYYLSYLVCALIFSLFVSMNWMALSTTQIIMYIVSVLLSVIVCFVFIKKTEKKTLFYIIAFLLIAFTINLIASFSLFQLAKSGIRFVLCLLFSLFILLRK